MFLDKIKSYLRLGDQSQEIKAEYASPRNEYYAKVAERFGVVQTLLYVMLTIVVLVSLMFNSEWITYENFYYFFSDMGDYITSSDTDVEDIMYTVDRNQSFALYNDKIAVSGNSGVKLYTSSGRLIINDDKTIGNPRLEESDRYLLMCDIGGTEFRVYNMFTEVYSDHAQNTILAADVSDSGDIAILTKSDTSRSSVQLLNSKFKLRKIYNRYDYAVDVSLTDNGKTLAVLSYSFEDGEAVANLCMISTDHDMPFFSTSIKGAFPLYCEYTSSGKLNVVCDDRIVSFDGSGRLIKELIYGEYSTAVLSDVNSDGAAVVSKNNDKFKLIVFDRNGNSVYNDYLSSSAESIRLYGNYVFVDGDTSIVRINLFNGSVKQASSYDFGAVMLIKSENELFLCLPERVKYIKFD